jgi:hypothetical protein
MKRTRTHISLVFSIILLAGCQPKKSADESVIRVPFESANAIDLGQFVERVHYVQLENQPESAFTDIDKMIVNGGNMFMLDKRLEAVFCFDTTGKFRYRIQRVGRGPGEYQELGAMWVKPAEKELWLQSFWPSKIMVYNYDGEMLREFMIRWSARDMVRVGDDLLAGYNNSRSNDGIDSLDEGIFLLREDGKSRGQARVLGDSSMYWSVSFQRNLEECRNGALLLSQSDTIFKINAAGEVSPDVFLDWGKLKYPDDLIGLSFNSRRLQEGGRRNYVSGKDQLIAFGPIRLFRIILDGHLELALADLNTQKGHFSTRINSGPSKVPLLYPLVKSDQNELIGIYDMSLLMAMKESEADRPQAPNATEFYHEMDSLVETALKQDRPVLWFAKIKQEWLTTIF